ncbi:hypothetical protein GGX14DRAFT_426840 [Mycena pura]|uniref:Uncharacterized protein n=1 Tax=Mycena pura TaxID=153505 RepID=A0AAD6YLG3_9AGAR|nr:hypothetical protein GGX14DRAFT_426840 [Mycena pura]
MSRYLFPQAVSGHVVDQDPTRRDRMMAELAASEDPRLRREPKVDPNDDYEALLQEWVKVIAGEPAPTDFRSHFFRIHYTFSAAVYYEHYFVTPAIKKYGFDFQVYYQRCLSDQLEAFIIKKWPHGQVNGNTLPSPPPPDHANIDSESAMALLSTPEVLLGMSFYQRHEIIPEIWRVQAINQKKTRDGSYVAFEVMFDGGREKIEFFEDDLKDLLLHSCVY